MEAIEYKLIIPLQQMALRKIAIILWNRFCSDSVRGGFDSLVKEMKEKVPLLGLPSLLNVKLMDLMLPIGTEILQWEKYHRWMLPYVDLSQLCWTPQGTVDYCESAKRLIRLGKLDNFIRYRLSCLFCFDDNIQKFWDELNEFSKKVYFNGGVVNDNPYRDESWRTRRAELVTLWTCYLNGNTDFIINQFEDEPKRTFNQYAFESAALSGNKAATKYFFQKLTIVEREVSLMETVRRVIEKRCLENVHFNLDFPEERFSDVGIYLLSQLSKAEQTEVFQKQSFAILACFLDWPWQDLFLNVAEKLCNYLSIQEYRGLLTILTHDYGYPIFNCEEIFLDFFRKSPERYKRGLFVDQSFQSNNVNFNSYLFPYDYYDIPDLRMEWFCDLITANKSECIKIVLKSMDRAERERLITGKFGLELCVQLVKMDKWSFLKLILEECELSKEAKEKMENLFMKCFVSKQKLGYKKRISILRKNKFLRLLGNTVILSNKRHIKELETEQSATSKKISMK